MIVILGANGMLGRAFKKYYGSKAVCLTREDCDFNDYDKLFELLSSIKFSVLINCAAIIDIAYIERFASKSFGVNVWLPHNLAEYCANRNCQFVQISTDHFYVDDLEMHSETSPISLVNKYAEQKFIAERLVFNAFSKSLVIRTSLLGYKNLDGNTLVEWILKTLKYEKSINGFYDAISSSIDTSLLCLYIDKAISHNLSGTYNVGTRSPYSKFRLIEIIIKVLGLTDVLLMRESVGFLKVPRANNCGLDTNKYARETLINMPTIDQVVQNLNVREFFNEI